MFGRRWLIYGVLGLVLITAGVAVMQPSVPERDSDNNRARASSLSKTLPGPDATAARQSPQRVARTASRPTASTPTDLTTAIHPLDKLISGAPVLAERVSAPDPQGRFERVRVYDTIFKYPNIRVVESMRQNASGAPVVASRVAMVADHVVVAMPEGLSDSDVRSWAESVGFAVRRLNFIPGSHLMTPKDGTLDDFLALDETIRVAQERSARAGVASTVIEPDYLLFATATPNDPNYSSLYGLHNTGQTGGTNDADIDASEAWDVSTGSRDIVVGVIDSGVQYSHPDLAANMWRNPGEIAGNGIDDDGNGFVDDVYGYDFYNNDANPDDDNNHGTHVAGTIGAVGNNNTGVVGVNWQVSMVALKFLGANGSGATSDAMQCVNYANNLADRGIKVVATNNSWGGGGYSSSMVSVIVQGRNRGIAFVAAAGNDGLDNESTPQYPSSYTDSAVISVASTTNRDQLSSFSNYGVTSVDLAAPGSSIRSTLPGGSYGTFSGTSMATPHVTGAIALAYAVAPNRSMSEVIAALYETVDPLASLSGRVATGGRLNVNELIRLLDGGSSTGLAAATISPGETISYTDYSTVVSKTLTVANTGEVSLDLDLHFASGESANAFTADDRIEVAVWNEFVWLGAPYEYTNVLDAVGRVRAARVTPFGGRTASDFANALVGKDVLILPAMWFAQPASEAGAGNGIEDIGAAIGSTLRDFVGRGGTVIFIRPTFYTGNDSDFGFVRATGLTDVSFQTLLSSSQMVQVETAGRATMMFSGLPDLYSAPPDVGWFSVNDPDLEVLARTNDGPLIAAKTLGRGSVIVCGVNYEATNDSADLWLGNAVRFGPSLWLRADSTRVTLAPGESADVGFTLDPRRVTPTATNPVFPAPDMLFSGVSASWSTGTMFGPAVVVIDAETPPPAPELVVAGQLDFGSVYINAESEASLSVSNTGNAELVVSSASVSGSGFALTSPFTGLTIPEAGNSSVSLTFSPTSVGPQSGSLSLASNDPNNPTAVVALSGSGVWAPSGYAAWLLATTGSTTPTTANAPLGDLNQNGIPNILEYYQGQATGGDISPSNGLLVSDDGVTSVVRYRFWRNAEADGASLHLEVSSSLVGWTRLVENVDYSTSVVGRAVSSTGIDLEQIEATIPVSGDPQQFFIRLAVDVP